MPLTGAHFHSFMQKTIQEGGRTALHAIVLLPSTPPESEKITKWLFRLIFSLQPATMFKI